MRLLRFFSNFPFRKKISIAFIIILLIPSMVIAYMAFSLFLNKMQENQLKQIEYTSRSIGAIIQDFEKDALSYINILTSDQLLIEQLKGNEREALTYKLAKFYSTIKKDGVDYLEVVDKDGNVVVNAHNMRKHSINRSYEPTIARALKGEQVNSTLIEGGGMVLLSVSPVYDNEKQIIGAISVGYYIQNDMADKIKHISGADITIFQRGRAIASSIKKNDIRLVDHKIENEKIMKTVLEQGEEYTINTTFDDESFSAKYIPVKNLNDEVIGMQMLLIPSIKQEMTNTIFEALTKLMIIGSLAVVVVLVIGHFFGKTLANPLVVLLSHVKKVAEGDIRDTSSLTSKDEFGELSKGFNVMIKNLQNMIYELNNVSNEMCETNKSLIQFTQKTATSSEESATIVENFTEGTRTQFESINRIVKVINETSLSIKHMVESIYSMEKSTFSVQEKTTKGKNTISEIGNNMNNISHSVTLSSEAVQKLSETATQINNIVEVINSIADETNLLAINASIEASRVGEIGKGFKVVANEVKNLAVQSKESAEQVIAINQQVFNEINIVTSRMNEGVKQVNNGVVLMGDVDKTFSDILDEVTHISNETTKMSKSATTLSKEAETVNKDLQEISSTIKEIDIGSKDIERIFIEQMDSMEQISKQALSLEKRSKDLDNVIKNFKIDPKKE